MKTQIVIRPIGALLSFDKRTLKKVLRQAGGEVAAVAKRLIRSSSGGPGQPPKNRTGDLVRGIKVTVARSGMSVRVSDSAASPKGFMYAVALEGGSQGGGPGLARVGSHQKGKYQQRGRRVVLPRPFISLALDQRRDSIADRVQDSVIHGVAFKRIKP